MLHAILCIIFYAVLGITYNVIMYYILCSRFAMDHLTGRILGRLALESPGPKTAQEVKMERLDAGGLAPEIAGLKTCCRRLAGLFWRLQAQNRSCESQRSDFGVA